MGKRKTFAREEGRELPPARPSREQSAEPQSLSTLRTESVQETLATQGQNLSEETRAFMEPRFGHDFSQVRIHTDTRAAQSAQTLEAQAYTVGQDIVFGAGQYTPETQEGRGLLAHELTHVVQQRGTTDGSPLTVGPVNDSAEQEADKISSSITSNASFGMGGATDISARPGAGVLIQRKPTAEQRLADLEKREEATEERLANMENHQKAQDIHQKAVDLDMLWQAKFDQQFSKYHEAVDRISAGLQTATKGFQEAQSKQAEFEAAVMGVFKAALTIAGGLEWAFVPGLGKLAAGANATKEAIEKSTETVERIVSTTHAVADVGLDYAKEAAAKKPETPATESIPGAQMPAGAAGGDPLAFLTSNSALLERHRGSIEQAFIQRSNTTRAYSDDDWLRFDPAAQEKIYQQLFTNLQTVASSADDLVSDNEIALVLERHLWARWISEQAESMDKDFKEMGGYPYSMEFGGEKKNPAEMMFTPGAEIEKRLKEINVDILAGVELTGHWYSSNSPDNWRELLINWAKDYSGTISKTIQGQQMQEVDKMFKDIWGGGI